MKATKQELRREIRELRHVGRQMANVAFNMHQRVKNTPEFVMMWRDLYQQWDAIKRAEKS